MKKRITVCIVLLLMLCGCGEVQTVAETTVAETTVAVETTQEPTIEETQAPTEPLTEEGIPVDGELAFSIAYIDLEGKKTIIRYNSGVYGDEEGYGSEVIGKYEYNPQTDAYSFSDSSEWKNGYSGVAILEVPNSSLEIGDIGIGYYCKGGRLLPLDWEAQNVWTVWGIMMTLSFTLEDGFTADPMKLGDNPSVVVVEDLAAVGYGTSEPDVLKDAGIEPTIIGE